MKNIKYNCEFCESEFSLSYDEEKCVDDPNFCSFCGEYLIDETIETEDQ